MLDYKFKKTKQILLSEMRKLLYNLIKWNECLIIKLCVSWAPGAVTATMKWDWILVYNC